ncbi:hypothetical protein CLUG_04621 [Clavispora lusitaniae ATCC 42720]|uniref:Uncharacterized protein n=1 Tax=Clavispora lusitaniae (strain ATCC 42720) TaxID=306902 RepID=C4Y8U3_CLAL4|nr:uncharacterized protein CLUG_04621 [Clavispora lusitaniae ATCC 42720]EEQ40493.1 hypothetical protein CLUG_04621 [Clavispora lusitaniae ATCC 42720]
MHERSLIKYKFSRQLRIALINALDVPIRSSSNTPSKSLVVTMLPVSISRYRKPLSPRVEISELCLEELSFAGEAFPASPPSDAPDVIHEYFFLEGFMVIMAAVALAARCNVSSAPTLFPVSGATSSDFSSPRANLLATLLSSCSFCLRAKLRNSLDTSDLCRGGMLLGFPPEFPFLLLNAGIPLLS